MLIFDGKLMIFEAFLRPIYGEHVFYMFLYVFCRFFELKIVSDDFAVLNMNGDFGPTRLSVKKRFFPDEPSERKDAERRVHFH